MEDSENRSGGDSTPEERPSPADLRAVYDEIASHFSKTRAYPWPEVQEFLDSTTVEESDAVGVDVGCGNGRHTELLDPLVDRTVGIDVSRELLDEARAKMNAGGWRGQLLQGDAESLPVGTDAVAVAVYVATLHHLADREARIESLRELSRVLADGGHGLVSAWSTVHDRFDADPDEETGFETTVDWTLPGGETVPRFYYIYTPAEFEQDIRASGLEIVDCYVSSGNCYAEVTSG